LTISGATYYVSPGGSDSNPGTISQPFFTLNKAWSVVSAGDIIYMRGGTYRYNNTGSSLTGKSGTSGNLISILAYPGEKPIINYDNVTFTSQLVGISLQNDSYIYFKGIRVTGINQPAAGSTAQYGIILWDKVSNCTFEQMETDHIGGWGVVIGSNSNNDLFLNCDSHHNADPNTGSYNGEPYGWSDGFESGSHGANTSTNIIFRGCRAWSNSDDGWDLRQADGVYTIENCWSFWNGYIPGTQNQGGDGEGYKLGGSTSQTSSIIRTVKNCLAFENRLVGFSPEPDVEPNYDLGVAVYNSTSYHNALGINFQYKSVAILKNNIIYANTVGAMYSWGANVTHDHNAGVISDLTNTVTDADFQSVNSAGMDGPRQADGSLPNLSFLHLAAGSKLIDAGVDVGLPYTGKAPDLGAFELQSGSTKPNSPPVVVINNEADSYSGFVYGIDASGSSDPDNDVLTYAWTGPNNVSVSSTSSLKIQFLAPIVNTNQTIQFQLKVTDGTTIVTKSIAINLIPYKPELEMAKIKTVQGSSYQSPDYPNNVSDGSLTTKWSAIGDNQWLVFALTEAFKISHLDIAFLSGQTYSSYFDIYASKDNITWEPILLQATSCNFSGDIQAFDFPALNTNTEYSYIKYVGHGNSLDTRNTISEFRIFGTPSSNPGSGDTPKINIIIYPNPASNLVNISIDANSVNPDKIEIIDHSGNVVFEKLLYSDTRNLQIPLNVKSGDYVVELFKNNSVLLAKKLIVMK
jgi:hypothetical protein